MNIFKSIANLFRKKTWVDAAIKCGIDPYLFDAWCREHGTATALEIVQGMSYSQAIIFFEATYQTMPWCRQVETFSENLRR